METNGSAVVCSVYLLLIALFSLQSDKNHALQTSKTGDTRGNIETLTS